MGVGQALRWRQLLVPMLVGLGSALVAPAAGASPDAAAQTAPVVGALLTTTYGSVLVATGPSVLAGAPLYMFSGDADGKFGCTIRLVPSAFDIGSGSVSIQVPDRAESVDPPLRAHHRLEPMAWPISRCESNCEKHTAPLRSYRRKTICSGLRTKHLTTGSPV